MIPIYFYCARCGDTTKFDVFDRDSDLVIKNFDRAYTYKCETCGQTYFGIASVIVYPMLDVSVPKQTEEERYQYEEDQKTDEGNA